jgi:hypothetical protein
MKKKQSWKKGEKMDNNVTKKEYTNNKLLLIFHKLFKLHKLFKCMIKGGIMVNSNDSFDKEKFKQVLHYIIFKSGVRDNVGKVVLYKMMYFSDFDFYELYNKSITGETYVKLPYGPGPSHFDGIVGELQKEGKVEEKNSKYGGRVQKKVIPITEPKLDRLNGEEIKVIDKVINRLSGMSATQVTEHSHEDIPWKATEKGGDIDYELVFYRNQKHSVSQPVLA